LFQPTNEPADSRLDQLRATFGRRLVSLVLALLAEAVLVLALLSLGLSDQQPKPPGTRLVSVNVAPDKAPEPEQPEPVSASKPLQQPQLTPPPLKPVEQRAVPLAPALIQIPRDQMAQFDIAQLPRQPAAPPVPGKTAMGPPNLGVAGDSKRVGSAPNGEPMYAAAWYREPYDDELSGYLSTADGPGWGLIACRTAPDFRVEDCVGLDEYPSGSRIERAVLAAAWQFRVRPPRVGGVSKVGEWVRIRIDYGIRRK
jgi:periplasmic protein TonB